MADLVIYAGSLVNPEIAEILQNPECTIMNKRNHEP